MAGLQVLVDDGGSGGEKRCVWVDVPPVRGALVINVGDLLQLVSNGRLKSVDHRVVANRSSDRARISVAAFFNADLRRTEDDGGVRPHRGTGVLVGAAVVQEHHGGGVPLSL
ncbi:hypothetical protein VPH35_013293 [Triticum aestivum]|uniref:DIBOA-glucoside dioxygenase BX6-like n=1 Tax=Triticum aestivum TaxID=4565 RepID=UPI001D035416|nr:DIBOA-glucoside dioxygenase BX6-like [Triticum aestivum]